VILAWAATTGQAHRCHRLVFLFPFVFPYQECFVFQISFLLPCPRRDRFVRALVLFPVLVPVRVLVHAEFPDPFLSLIRVLACALFLRMYADLSSFSLSRSRGKLRLMKEATKIGAAAGAGAGAVLVKV